MVEKPKRLTTQALKEEMDTRLNNMSDTLGTIQASVNKLVGALTTPTKSAQAFYGSGGASAITPTNIETVSQETQDTFESVIKEYASKITVSKPFKTAYTLNLPAISCEEHQGVRMGGACRKCKSKWKAVAFAGRLTSTKRYTMDGKRTFTTYIMPKHEDVVFKILQKHGIHIPPRDKKDAPSSESSS